MIKGKEMRGTVANRGGDDHRQKTGAIKIQRTVTKGKVKGRQSIPESEVRPGSSADRG